ncbi:hypothetical protein [Halobacteriovorax sp.]|uniref:hypothetical protein n=1 Tax=Halobacteriovorax sp. TaxID=2020862 RepID=UPI003AF2A201
MKNILIGVVLLTSISAIANCNIIIKTAPACETMLKYESRHGGGRCTYFQDDITSAVEKLGFGAHDDVSRPKLMHNILNSNIQCR